MATVTLDTIEGSELDNSVLKTTRVRTGVITDIDLSSQPDPLVLESAVGLLNTAGIVLGVSTYPSNPTWRLTTIRVYGVSNNAVRFALIYATPDWGGGSAYLIRDGSYLTTLSTQLLPGPLKIPFRVGYLSLEDPNNPPIKEDSIFLQILVPVRTIQITKISLGAPPTGLRPYLGYVNSDAFGGVTNPKNNSPAGMWMFTKFQSDISRYASSYQIEAEFAGGSRFSCGSKGCPSRPRCRA